MPLTDITLPAWERPVPAPVMEFIQDAEARIDAFVERRRDTPIPAFVPSDYVTVYGGLRLVLESHTAPGNLFCEWGSGFGVVAGLASMAGFTACGIEIEPDLVEEATELMAQHALPVELVEGSFIPPGGEDLANTTAEMAWLSFGGPDGHEQLDMEPDEMDVIFAYPWPGEENIVEDLFERYAAVGAVLMTYRGVEDLRLQRKVSGSRRG